jgi:hypothetical protein
MYDLSFRLKKHWSLRDESGNEVKCDLNRRRRLTCLLIRTQKEVCNKFFIPPFLTTVIFSTKLFIFEYIKVRELSFISYSRAQREYLRAFLIPSTQVLRQKRHKTFMP